MPTPHVYSIRAMRRGGSWRYRQVAGVVRLAALYIDVACARTASRTGRPIEISALLSFHSRTLRLARLYPAFGVDTGAIFCNRLLKFTRQRIDLCRRARWCPLCRSPQPRVRKAQQKSASWQPPVILRDYHFPGQPSSRQNARKSSAVRLSKRAAIAANIAKLPELVRKP